MNVYLVEVKRHFKSLMIWIIAVTLVLSLFLAFFPSMATSEMAELVRAKISAIPPEMRGAFGISDIIDFSDMLQYFAYVIQFIYIAACIYSILLGASALIKEEGEGTIEFLYAKPITRGKIITMKIMSMLTLIIIFNIFMYIVCIIYGEAFKKANYQYIIELRNIFLSIFSVQATFLFVGFVFSAIIKKYRYATPIGLGIFFITYLLGTFSKIIDQLDFLKYTSPFHYAIPLDLLKTNGSISILNLILLLAIITISLVITYIKYSKKDLIV